MVTMVWSCEEVSELRVSRRVPAKRPKLAFVIVDGSRDFEKTTVTAALGPMLIEPAAGVIEVIAGAVVSVAAAVVKVN